MTDDDKTDHSETGDAEISIVDDSPESGIEALRQQLTEAANRAEQAERERDDERRARQSEVQARQEAERRVLQISEEARTTQRSAHDAQYDAVINALAASQSDLDRAKAAYNTAISEGDFTKVADLTEAISVAASRVRDFEAGKTAIEQRRQAPEQRTPAQQQDPKESYINRMPPRTATWLRRNDRFFTDNSFQRMVQGADALARGRGIEPESDDYFRFIEEQVGLRDQDTSRSEASTSSSANPGASTSQATPPRMPAAPAGGSTAAAARTTLRPNEVRLTAEERALCRDLDITEAAYARQKIAALARGEIGDRR